MYVKYLMAGFLGVFAVSMMVQFCAYLLESVADYRGDPGSRLHAHDEENTTRVGDRVEIMETRPMSRTKTWRIVRVVREGNRD